MLSTIQGQQDDLRTTLKHAEAVLVKAGEIETSDVAEMRPKLISQLKEYTEFKHESVFPALLASSDPVTAQLAAQLKARCDAMADFYRRYLTEWPVTRVVEQPALYRGVALDVIGRLRRHFVREEADVVTLTGRPTPITHPTIERHV